MQRVKLPRNRHVQSLLAAAVAAVLAGPNVALATSPTTDPESVFRALSAPSTPGTTTAGITPALAPANTIGDIDVSVGQVVDTLQTPTPTEHATQGASTDVVEESSEASAFAASGDIEAAPVEVTSVSESAPDNPRVDLTRRTEDLWQRIRNGFSMPDLNSPRVNQAQAAYLSQPNMLKLLAERSRRYLFHIVEELEKRGMPTELALLPMVESAFNPMAYSRAHASGLWQFIPSTGRNYNLEQNWWVDERRDVVASTTAALDYLQKIYEMHGDWHLALASYNWGEWAVARAVERNRQLGRPTDYSSLPMPAETRYYVPKLQALKNIIANPSLLGVELDPIANAPYFATVTLTRDIDLGVAARLAEMPVDELIALNPSHNRPVVMSSHAPSLVLPTGSLERFLQNLSGYTQPLSSWRVYSAQRGERVDQIASRHGTSVDVLREVNGIRGTGRLRSDAQILVPASELAERLPGQFRSPATIWAEPGMRALSHVVRKGESWQSIAGRYRVNADQLQSWNSAASLKTGGRITVYVPNYAPAKVALVTGAKRAQPATVKANTRAGAKATGARKAGTKVQLARQ